MSAPLENKNENVWKGLDKFKQGLSQESEETDE